MDSKTPRIRPLTDSDRKLVLFTVGKANLEGLAVANHQAYTNPLVLGAWMLFSLAFIHMMNWWPSNYRGALGILGYLKPLPAFASMAVPLMFLIDWINRPHFEQRTQEAIRGTDMHEPVAYYGKWPASGFWILEYGERFIGLIALDAKDAKRTHKGIIKHFFVEEAYRETGVQEDLLRHALKNAFESSSAVEYIEAVDALSLTPYQHTCYQRAGFNLQEYQSAGNLGQWKYYKTVLQREDWKH